MNVTEYAMKLFIYYLILSKSISCSLLKAWVVSKMEFGADGKVAKKIQDKFKSIHPEGSFFLASLDDDEEK